MNYDPKILYNPTDETVEFMCGGRIHIFEPGQKKNTEGFVAHHALKETNTGLKEYTMEDGKMPETTGDLAYEKMPWRKLVSLGSERGVFKSKMNKEELLKALIEQDEQEAGAI